MNLVLRKGPDGTDLPPTAINRKLLYERKYDSKGTTILSLETALQWKFNKFIDQHSPKLWPAIPLKFWLLANHSYSWKQHHCRLREASIQQCTINWKLLKSRENVFWKKLRKNSFWVHPRIAWELMQDIFCISISDIWTSDIWKYFPNLIPYQVKLPENS